ncbi:hypothetical protein RRK58_000655 [Vibrio fluvialis]|nr:hypothetical protein [Vibrio fluvialis]EKO3541446.1 hypothetical protein [Vibrio fluvialis]ELH7948890.1 hypothetical protein [Vibrio fluvialis]ELI5736686.1 hypothetical protein [Vibrio fluvialis]ELO4023058.1 hypothetical protein [Vibrio fluvialis]
MNVIPSKRLNALLGVLPLREIPEQTRSALRLVFESGYSYELASLRTGVSSKRISLAARKMMQMDAMLLDAYRL